MVEFDCKICDMLHQRLEELVPHGLYNLWFDVKNGDGTILAAYLGYSYDFFQDMILLSPKLSGKNGRYLLAN